MNSVPVNLCLGNGWGTDEIIDDIHITLRSPTLEHPVMENPLTANPCSDSFNKNRCSPENHNLNQKLTISQYVPVCHLSDEKNKSGGKVSMKS